MLRKYTNQDKPMKCCIHLIIVIFTLIFGNAWAQEFDVVILNGRVHGELLLKLLWGADESLGSESANGNYST